MEYKIKNLIISVLIVFALSACSNYIYTSRGTVEYPSGETKTAVLYWRMDDGRLYYGPKYSEKDSGVTLRICNRPPKSLEPDERGNTEDLVLLGKTMDLQIAEIDAMGEIAILETAIPINPQNRDICGKIITTASDGSNNLSEGGQPEVVFLCKNTAKVNRYPKADRYIFDSVERTEYIDENSAPKPCIENQ